MKILLALSFLILAGCTMSTSIPTFIVYAPLRNVGNLGPVVTDVESHLVAGHPYRDADRITWVHEGTHGIAGQLRNKYQQPGFYLLENRAILMREPATTLAAVAATVPLSLRGEVYNLYLIQAQQWWQNEPTYVFDEWVAYANGSDARAQLKITSRGEAVQYAVEFIPYALCVPKAARSQNPQMKAFIRWHIERTLALYRASGVRSDTLNRLRTAKDAEALRQFTRTYLGADWTSRTLGF